MLDLRRLRLLRELAYRRTIAAVAQALSYSPSAVSQQLAILEREAGVPLLERNGRGVELTPAGRRLVEHAELVLAQLESAAAELEGSREGLSGPVRIGTFATAGRVVVPAALGHLAASQPGIEPMVTEIDPALVGPALRAGELDVALIQEYDFVPARREAGLGAEPLFSEPMYLAAGTGAGRPKADRTDSDVPAGTRPGQVASGGTDSDVPAGTRAGQAAAGGTDSGLAALAACAGEPWITATSGTLCHAMTIRACQAAGFEPRVRHRIDDFDTVLTLVAAGQGVSVVPQLAVAGSPPAVTLVRLPMQRRTLVAFRRGAGRHPAVSAVTAALRAAVPPELHEP